MGKNASLAYNQTGTRLSSRGLRTEGWELGGVPRRHGWSVSLQLPRTVCHRSTWLWAPALLGLWALSHEPPHAPSHPILDSSHFSWPGSYPAGQSCSPARAVSLASRAALGSFPLPHPLPPQYSDGGSTSLGGLWSGLQQMETGQKRA